MRVVHHQDAGPLAGPFGMRHVTADAVPFLGEHARDDHEFLHSVTSVESPTSPSSTVAAGATW